MSFFSATNQKRMGGKAVYVGAIKRKIKNATRLVVLRGAKVGRGEYKGTPYAKVVFDEEEVTRMDGRGWIMPGWSYVFFPTTEVYRMPYPDLVSCIRDALRFVYTRAHAMEQGWLKAEERKFGFRNPSPSRPGPSSRTPTVPRKSPKAEDTEGKKPGKSSPKETWLRYKRLSTLSEKIGEDT